MRVTKTNNKKPGRKNKSPEEFQQELEEIHGNQIIPLEEYVRYNKKILFKCNRNASHPNWRATPAQVLSGEHCPACSKEVFKSKKRLPDYYYLEEATKALPDTIEVTGNLKRKRAVLIEVQCKVCHNVWYTRIGNIHAGHGCKVCNLVNARRKSTEAFKEQLYEVKGDRVSLVGEYKNAKTKVRLHCNVHEKHPDWYTKPNTILQLGCGCPRCHCYLGEMLVGSILDFNNVSYEYQKGVKISGKQHVFDFIIRTNNRIFALETDGEQHFKSVEAWGGEKALVARQAKDAEKDNYIHSLGGSMIRIPYDKFNLTDMLQIISDSLDISLVRPPDNYTPVFKRVSEMVKYYNNHTARETSIKYKTSERKLKEYYKAYYGKGKRDMLREEGETIAYCK